LRIIIHMGFLDKLKKGILGGKEKAAGGAKVAAAKAEKGVDDTADKAKRAADKAENAVDDASEESKK
jgi:hypothetical protein